MNREEFWQNKPVLVTGATGFLGGWLVKRLLQLGSRVITIVRRNRSESQFFLSEFSDRTIVYRGSVSNRRLIRSVFRENEIETVFHTAALSDVNDVLRNPEDCFRSCVESTWWLLENLRKIQTELGLSILFVRAVTLKTPIRENRSYIPVETNCRLRHARNGKSQDAKCNESHFHVPSASSKSMFMV